MDRIADRTLYKNHGKSVGFWSAWAEKTEDGGAKVKIEYAKTLDGKVVPKEYEVKGKNIGRSNETTPIEQAQLEVDSRTNKQLDKGYVYSKEEAEKAKAANSLGLEMPMLATPIEKVKPEKIEWANAYAQKKLDGHRAMFKDGVLYSRQGKVIDLPHITDAIVSAGIDHLHLDGELYLHGKTLQEIGSLVKRKQEGSEDLVYYIYDKVGDAPWDLRITTVTDQGVSPESWPLALKVLTGSKMLTFEQLQEFHERQLKAGYEGTMLRWGGAGYQDGKRSKHLLKLKEFKCDSEFVVTSVERGVPHVTAGGTFEVPVWVLRTPEGKEFRATAPGNLEEKNNLWLTRESYIGRNATIQYHYLSADGVPQLPVALRLREEL